MSELIKTILKHRGYTRREDRETFLCPDYSRHTHDPGTLPDMDAAVGRIRKAIEAGEAITIYGDYDIDGLSATALLQDALTSMGAHVTAYIPDRFEEGYGINTEALRRLHAEGSSLVVTVDCGSVSHAPLEWAAATGLDIIVTDHHETGPAPDGLPPAVAIINPKRPDSQYPFGDLAGVGVAFKLVCALQNELTAREASQGASSARPGAGLPSGQEKWLLDLVALGTVCDVVDLVDENRVFVTYGLRVFGRTPRIGLQALARVSGMSLHEVEAHHFGFVLGPRLNAAGRLEHARRALEVLTTDDGTTAATASAHLDALNTERRRQQDVILDMANQQADAYAEDPVLVLSHPEWSHGIAGIVAAKIMERWSKPTIVLQEEDGVAKGSARSLGGFNMVSALASVQEVLDKYGGHHVAAGCTLPNHRIDELRQRLNEYYRRQQFTRLTAKPIPDVELGRLDDMTLDMYEHLQQLAPFGKGNPRPLFYVPDLQLVECYPVGKQREHLKLLLSDGDNEREAIAFGKGECASRLDRRVAAWFELDVNTYRGRSRAQLRVKEIV